MTILQKTQQAYQKAQANHRQLKDQWAKLGLSVKDAEALALHLGAVVKGYADPPTPGEKLPTSVRLPVEWLSQLAPETATFAAGDCGSASLAMWLNLLGHHVTVDDVSKATGLARGFRFTVFDHLRRAAKQWDRSITWHTNQSIDVLRGQLLAGRPAIVLIHYPSLPYKKRYDPNYPYSHWVLVVGFDEDHIFYHDPYFPDTSSGAARGAFVAVKTQAFKNAWGNNHKAGNRHSDKAVIVEQPF